MAGSFYNANPLLKSAGVQVEYSPEQIAEYVRCAEDPIYFIKNYIKIISLDRGLINFDLFDYQIRFIKEMHENRRVIGMMGRQQGKTTTTAAYICWYILFNDSKTAAILANKAAAAREIMSRVQLMYENLPMWLQQGVVEWNKGSITLENNSKAFTAATSSSGIRGKSCVTSDTRVCIELNGGFFYREIDKFINNSRFINAESEMKKYAIYKTTNILNGKIYIGFHTTTDSEIIRKHYGHLSCFSDGYLGSGKLIKNALEKYGAENFFQEIIEIFDNKTDAENLERQLVNEDYVKLDTNYNISIGGTILTSNGFKNFHGFISQGISKSLYHLSFISGRSIKVTGDHRFLLPEGEWVRAEEIFEGDELLGDTVESITQIENEEVFDALEVQDTHDYYTNGVISHNCNFLYIDECAIIPNTVAEDFFTATYPTISSGKTTKIVLTSTPLGLNHFWKFWTEAESGVNGFKPVRVEYWEHPERDEKWAQEQKNLLGELKFQQEVMMSFLGSSSTLISADSIQRMAIQRPLYEKDGLAIYEKPFKGGPSESGPLPQASYVMLVDTSEGVGGDFSTFSIIRIDKSPYKLVARFKDNRISPLIFPTIISRVAKEYNEAMVLVEANKAEQVPYILHNELEYENILYVGRSAKQGQKIGGSPYQLGLKMDKKIKKIGCSTLKDLIEQNKLLIHDSDTISEISTFIEDGKGSYSADDGKHDDLVMPLVMFGWLVNDPYFQDMTDMNLRDKIFRERLDLIEQETLPIGFYNDGRSASEESQWIDYHPN